MVNKLKLLANTEEKKRLLSNFFSLSILQLFNYILPLITFPYLVRVLGVEKFGLIAFAQSFIIFFNILVSFGFGLSAVKEISIYRDNKDKLTEIFSSIMIIKIVLIVISFIILTVIVFSFQKFKEEAELFYLTFLIVIGQALFPIWYFQGLEKMQYVTIINVISKLIFTSAIFIFIHSVKDYLLVPLLNGLGFIIGGIISLWILFYKFKQKFKLQSFKTLWFYFKESSQFFYSRLAVSIYTSSNAFILGLFTNNTIVGYYSIAEKLYNAYTSFFQPIVQTLYPYIAKYKDIKKFKKVYIFVLISNFILLLMLYIIAPFLVKLISGKEVTESIEAFRYFLGVLIVVIPSILVGYPLLAALGYKGYANYSVVVGAVLHILILSILSLVNKITLFSVILSVFFTELVVLMIRYYAIIKFKLLKRIKDE